MDQERIIIRRNKEASIEKILKAAAVLFSTKGYHMTTYSDIANIANLNISLISRYFGSKEGLLQATVNMMSSNSESSFAGVPNKDSLKEELHMLADILMNNMTEHKTEMKAVASVASIDKNFRDGLYVLTGINAEIENRLKKFTESGEIHKTHNLRYITDTFISIVNSMTMFLELTFELPNSNVRNRLHYVIEMFAEGLEKENTSKYPAVFGCDKE